MNKDVIEKREELLKEKISNIKKKWQDNKIKLVDDISVTYAKLHKSIGVSPYSKPTKKTGQFKEGKKRNIVKNPGLQDYFETPKFDRSKSVKKRQSPMDDLEKKWNKPLNKILFYV